MGEGHGDQQFTPGIGELKWGKVMATDDRQVTPGIGELKWGKVMATAYAGWWRFKWGKVMATDKRCWERMRMRMRADAVAVRVRVWERMWGQVCVRVRVLWARGIGQTSKMGIKLLQNYYYYSYIHEHANQGKRLLWR